MAPASYRLTPGWTPAENGFRGLAELMSAVVRSGVTGASCATGRSGALPARPSRGAGPPQELPRVLEALGFQATVNRGELRLSGCPCPIVAPDHPELVCGLADAVVEGVLAGTGSGLSLVRVRHDPERRACRGSLRSAA